MSSSSASPGIPGLPPVDFRIHPPGDKLNPERKRIARELENLIARIDRLDQERRNLRAEQRRLGPLHGTRSRAARGCPCAACKRSNADYMATLKYKEPKTHGTYTAYCNYRCRCPACREAGRQGNARYRNL